MKQNKFHGILVKLAFRDISFPDKFEVFSTKIAGDWIIYGISIEESILRNTIDDIQSHMRSDDNFYAHLYNDDSLVVIYKDRHFTISPHISSWDEAVDYGLQLGIMREQLDFWPNRFQDEIHYFG